MGQKALRGLLILSLQNLNWTVGCKPLHALAPRPQFMPQSQCPACWAPATATTASVPTTFSPRGLSVPVVAPTRFHYFLPTATSQLKHRLLREKCPERPLQTASTQPCPPLPPASTAPGSMISSAFTVSLPKENGICAEQGAHLPRSHSRCRARCLHSTCLWQEQPSSTSVPTKYTKVNE